MGEGGSKEQGGSKEEGEAWSMEEGKREGVNNKSIMGFESGENICNCNICSKGK